MPFRGHLIDWLQSVGPIWEGGTSSSAVPHSEIKAWAENIGLTFEGAEAEWLYKMSGAYADELSRSSDKDTAAPYVVN